MEGGGHDVLSKALFLPRVEEEKGGHAIQATFSALFRRAIVSAPSQVVSAVALLFQCE